MESDRNPTIEESVLVVGPGSQFRLNVARAISAPSLQADTLNDGLERLGDARLAAVVFAVDENRDEHPESVSLFAEFLSPVPLLVVSKDTPGNLLLQAIEETRCEFVRLDPETSAGKEQLGVVLETARIRGQALRADARFKRLYEQSIAGIFSIDNQGNFISANPALMDMLGISSERDLLDTNFVDAVCLPSEVGREFLRCLHDSGSIENAELILRTQQGSRITALVCASSLLDCQGEVELIECTIIDISDRKKAQDELTYLAKFDRLTGLANRYLFKEALKKTLARSQRQGQEVALLMIDLDRFKEINDTLGHDAGDALLRAVASRLKQCTRQSDTVARLGGDEFAVLIEETGEDKNYAAVVAKKICESLGQSYKIHGHEVSATPSIGIACAPNAGQHVDPLLKAADIAMYRAKAEGRNQFIFYSQQLHREVMDRVALEHNLRSAVESQDFAIVYQPKVDLRNGEIVELEALLRWTCQSRGPVGPDEFIPVLERTGLINPVGAWVVEQVCQQLVAWRDSLDRADLAVSINLSVKQIAQEQRLVDHIRAVLNETGLEPTMLEFEITESLLMNDPQSCIRTLERLRELGVRVVIDDFGTGFSSLQYLRTMPLHGLKIDKTFVSDLPGNTNDVAIVKATVALAQSLGLIVTAEGVETQAQAEFLTDLGCDLAQGYYFARPVEPERVPDLLLASADELPELARKNARRLASKFVAREKPYQIDKTSTVQLPYFDLNRTRH